LQWETLSVVIADKIFWDKVKVCVKVLLPAVKVLRYSDGMQGGTLGLLYSLLLQLDELYQSPIPGLPESVRIKVTSPCPPQCGACPFPQHKSVCVRDQYLCTHNALTNDEDNLTVFVRFFFSFVLAFRG
jgi:hypothetical protein